MAHLGLGRLEGVGPPPKLSGEALAVLDNPAQLLRGLKTNVAKRTGQTSVGGVELAAGVEEQLGGLADPVGVYRYESTPAPARGRRERAALAGAALPRDKRRHDVLVPGRGREPTGHRSGDRLLLVGRRLADVVETNQTIAEFVEVTLPAADGLTGRLSEPALERLRHHGRDRSQGRAPLGGKRQRLPSGCCGHQPQAGWSYLDGTWRHAQSLLARLARDAANSHEPPAPPAGARGPMSIGSGFMVPSRFRRRARDPARGFDPARRSDGARGGR